MSRVNLRSQNAQELTVAQADESLTHLSTVQILESDQQLHTGGDYISNGIRTLTLPATGNTFSITVRTGQVTFAGGTINGVSNAVITPDWRKTYAREGSDWKLLLSGATPENYTLVTTSRNFTAQDRHLWVNTTAASITLTLPLGLPNGTVFDVTRYGGNNLTIATSGTEGIRDIETGVPNTDGLLVNRPGDVRLYKQSGHWSYVAKRHDT